MRKCHFVLALAFLSIPICHAQSLGIFTEHSDVGTVLHAGSATYDSAKNAYTLVGSGENMWATADAFQFAWKKISGDVEISADVSFPNSGGNEHKKAVLMLRQSLDADSVYADVALHGNGLTSLQLRDEKGGITSEVESKMSAPARLRITRVGKYVYMSLAQQGSDVHFAGGSVRVLWMARFMLALEFVRTTRIGPSRLILRMSRSRMSARVRLSPCLIAALKR